MTRFCCVLLALLGLGCAPEVVPVELVFGNQDHFLRSSFFQVVVFPVERSGSDECMTRKDHAEQRVFEGAIFNTGARSMCDMVNEEVLLPDFPEGEHLFVGITMDRDKNIAYTSGCRAGRLVDSNGTVRIDMQTTEIYHAVMEGFEPLSCLTVQEMCSGRCEGGE